jgi:hypothetical protein
MSLSVPAIKLWGQWDVNGLAVLTHAPGRFDGKESFQARSCHGCTSAAEKFSEDQQAEECDNDDDDDEIEDDTWKW